MVRRQVRLTEQQLARVRREAVRRGISESAVIRDAVDRGLPAGPPSPTDEQWERALAAAGTGRSGLPDLSVEHDRYYTDDLYDDIVSKRRSPAG